MFLLPFEIPSSFPLLSVRFDYLNRKVERFILYMIVTCYFMFCRLQIVAEPAFYPTDYTSYGLFARDPPFLSGCMPACIKNKPYTCCMLRRVNSFRCLIDMAGISNSYRQIKNLLCQIDNMLKKGCAAAYDNSGI